MEYLKVISILLPILVALSGAGFYVHSILIEPNFDNGKYFTTAWIDYGINQNTLYVEFKPDMMGSGIPALKEAVLRVDSKALVNKKIDSKPLLIVMCVRLKTQLIEGGRVVISRKDIDIMKAGTPEENLVLLMGIMNRMELSYSKNTVMIHHRDGQTEYVPTDERVTNTTVMANTYIEKHGANFNI